MYDPENEAAEQTFTMLLHLIRTVPDRLGKKILASMLEDTALLAVVLEQNGWEAPEGGEQALLGDHWDKVEEERDDRAIRLMYAIQKNEF